MTLKLSGERGRRVDAGGNGQPDVQCERAVGFLRLG